MMAAITSDKKNVSNHILPTAANLLGLCFLILNLKKLWKAGKIVEIVDKADGIAILIFLAASVLSYASMRSSKRALLYEKIADIVFLAGLLLLSLIAVITVFELAN
jgi:hypothetical protein